ncbi:hypothetical protein SPONN_2714 [uncultured Candidatus Thioglobus sp.]|nr:hypothetical protein SPONN_2714 [uncultured Candidatus Thioglobus sp.]
MPINKITLNAKTCSIEVNLVNNIAKYLTGFNDSLLIERELNLDELQLLDSIFGY